MPEQKRVGIKLDLLKPQSNPEAIFIRATRWLLSTGRYIIIFVELLVLIAFISRFKFDADLAANKDSIDQHIPFIKSQKPDEDLIRQTQMQLATIKDFRLSSPDYSEILKKIASQTPQGVKVKNLNLEKNLSKINFKIIGSSLNNNELASFMIGLKSNPSFQDLNLSNVGLEQSTINFTITGVVNNTTPGDQNL